MWFVVSGEGTGYPQHLYLIIIGYREDEKEYEFPTSLGSQERCYIHRLARELGLQTKSRGKGAARFLTVYKKEGSTIMRSDASLREEAVQCWDNLSGVT